MIENLKKRSRHHVETINLMTQKSHQLHEKMSFQKDTIQSLTKANPQESEFESPVI
jgi:hypothetical protein